jgi:phage/plasmid-like protein (TIGR03299 family)
MSTETSLWLNQNTLIGYTNKRGTAWHYRASDQGDEPNHYETAVPLDDVVRRLFHWKATELPLIIPVPGPSGVTYKTVPDRKVIARDDSYDVLGVFKDGYTPHQYEEWLLNSVSSILDDDLKIGSAGLLKNGAIAWVSVEMEDNLVSSSGIEFRPHLLATTSFDGSISTTYKPVSTFVVCDNTRSAALAEATAAFKIKHTKNSAVRLVSAREALGVMERLGDDIMEQIEALDAVKVSDATWERFLRELVKDEAATDTGKKRAEHTRNQLRSLYRHDDRVAPWAGTAFGVSQAVNTWRQHVRPTRKVGAAERNMLDLVTGKTGAEDSKVLAILQAVTI